MNDSSCVISLLIVYKQIEQLEDEKEEWKEKCLETTDNNHQLTKKLEEVQRYLSDLPTMEEATRMEEEISFIY